MIMSWQPRLMNLSQGTIGGSVCLLISKSIYLDINNAKSPKQTNNENETHYIQIRFSNTYRISLAWIL